jgi:hypothetical protein
MPCEHEWVGAQEKGKRARTELVFREAVELHDVRELVRLAAHDDGHRVACREHRDERGAGAREHRAVGVDRRRAEQHYRHVRDYRAERGQ